MKGTEKRYAKRKSMLLYLCHGQWRSTTTLEQILKQNCQYPLSTLCEDGLVEKRGGQGTIPLEWQTTPLGEQAMLEGLSESAKKYGAHPIPCVRNENCFHFWECLSLAAKHNWDAFSCQKCRRFDE